MAHEIRLNRRRSTRQNEENNSPVSPPQNGGPVRGERALPWIVGAMSFLIYLRTMTPAMQMGDGTELAAAAQVLGVPHPTGYPLYMLLTKFWLLVTVAGDVIARTTILNGILMAAAVGVTSLILTDLLRLLWKTPPAKSVMIWSAAGALTAAFLRFHWGNAVVTEVYALQFLLMVAFVRCLQKMDGADSLAQRRLLLWTAALLGLALSHHRLSITLILPWAVCWFWVWKKLRATKPALQPSSHRMPWISAALIVSAGLSLYAYLPIRAAVDPPINWGNPDSPARFYNHVRGTEYLDRGLLKPGPGQTFSAGTLTLFAQLQTLHLLTDMADQLAPFEEQYSSLPGVQKIFIKGSLPVLLLGMILVVLAGLAAVFIWRSGGRFAAFAIATVAAQNLLILYIYNIVDIRDYFLFPLWAGWLGVFAFIAWLARKLADERRLACGYILLLLPVAVLAGNWHRSDHSDESTAEVLSSVILPESTDLMPPGSILLTDDDSETFTTWYRQKVRGDRSDVLHFAGNFVYMPWYRTFFTPAQIPQYHIQLASGVAHSAEEYASQLRTAIIDANVATHPIFTSIDDAPVLAALQQTYTIEPVDAVELTNRTLFDKPTTTVLYRIRVKDHK